MKDVLTPAQRQIFDAYNKTGRIAFLYPRKGTIAINGMPAKPIKEAIARMKETLHNDSFQD